MLLLLWTVKYEFITLQVKPTFNWNYCTYIFVLWPYFCMISILPMFDIVLLIIKHHYFSFLPIICHFCRKKTNYPVAFADSIHSQRSILNHQHTKYRKLLQQLIHYQFICIFVIKLYSYSNEWNYHANYKIKNNTKSYELIRNKSLLYSTNGPIGIGHLSRS